jgi:hypothetical protein
MWVGLSRLRRLAEPVYFINGDCILRKRNCRRFVDFFWTLDCLKIEACPPDVSARSMQFLDFVVFISAYFRFSF